VYHLFYGATNRTVFAIGIASLIYTCHTRPHLLINRLLSHRALVPLASLSYSVYLIHHVPIYFTYFVWGWHPPTFDGTFSWALLLYGGHLLTSYAFSLVAYLLVEQPAVGMEKVVRGWLAEREGKQKLE
jgi:peptidoglycan/LPS O-acetylase OafA/YrhL